MAALDFPPSPQLNDKYPVPAVAGVPQYTFDGVKWTTVGAQITTAKPADALPLMDAATASIGVATDYAREDHVHPKIPAAPMDAMAYSGIQVNGSMEVAQEAGPAVVQNTAMYIIDNWVVQNMSAAGVVSCGKNTSIFPPGFTASLETYTTAGTPSPAPNDLYRIFQLIEGFRFARMRWGTPNAQPLTIAFWVWTGQPGTYSGSIINYDATISYPFLFTVNAANTWQYITITIPGPVNGAWLIDERGSATISITLMAGSLYRAPAANAWFTGEAYAGPTSINASNAENQFLISGFIALPGIEVPVAERSPFIMRPFDQELLTCMRYFERLSVSIAGSLSPAGTNSHVTWFFKVQKRALPSFALIVEPGFSLFSTSVDGASGYQAGAVPSFNIGSTANARL